MGILLNLPYYYGRAGEQYAFFRIPKLLLTDERFAEVSTDAKLLYGLLLDRMELSYRNGWIDEQNRVFIIFTAEEVMSTLHCRSEKAARLFAELDSSKGIGLIERKRQGLGRPMNLSIWRNRNMKKLKKKTMLRADKMKKCYWTTAGVAVLCLCCATPAMAAGSDLLDIVNNLSDFIFSIIKALGVIILGWGIVQVGMSIQSHDASQRTQGFLCLFGGLMIAFAKEILSAIGAI